MRTTEHNRKENPGFTGLAIALATVLVIPVAATDLFAEQRRPASATSEKSWSGRRTSGTTSRVVAPGSSSRETTVQRRNGKTTTGSRQVTRDGNEVVVDRQVQSSTGASIDRRKEYEIDNGRVESVERSVAATDRHGRTSDWNGQAQRDGDGWRFEGEG